MRRLSLVVAGMLAAAACPTAGEAQLQPTDRIRILTNDGITFTGLLTEIAPDSLRLSDAAGAHWVRQAEIAYLERSTGRHRRFPRNFAVTVISAAAAGGMIGAISYKECVSNQFLGCLMAPESRMDAFLFGAVFSGVFSVPVGVILGLGLKYERWEPAPTEIGRRSRVSIAPRFNRGLGMSASISF